MTAMCADLPFPGFPVNIVIIFFTSEDVTAAPMGDRVG